MGRAVPGVSLRLVSLETGDPLPTGEFGEIEALSNSVMAGYLPESETPATFHDGWYRTGDVGYLDDGGWLRVTDRAKEMIKVRGFQVAPAEVEAVLHGHPAVKECAVFGVPHDADGEAVVAAVALHQPVPAGELIALVGARLASYKRPSEVVFVPDIPRLPSGKVLRRVLKETAAAKTTSSTVTRSGPVIPTMPTGVCCWRAPTRMPSGTGVSRRSSSRCTSRGSNSARRR